MQRLVLSVVVAVAVVLVPADPVSAGLWEKFWAKKHAHHNSARGVKHNHYHHHRAGDCGSPARKSCQCESHGFTAPVYQPPVYQPPVYQPPIVQPSVQQTLIPQRLVPQPVLSPPVAAPLAPPVSWQQHSRLEYRLQAQTQTVPVTRHRTVAVDEGSWQKIWVPKLVTKQVPETVYQQQTVYQQVPYQVTQQVPRVNYVSSPMAIAVQSPPAWLRRCSPGYPHANWIGYGWPPPMSAPRHYTLQPSTLLLPSTVVQPPVTLGPEIEPLHNVGSSPAARPVPEPRADYGELTPVRSAESSPSAARSAVASGMFVPAPSAANIWRARQRSGRR